LSIRVNATGPRLCTWQVIQDDHRLSNPPNILYPVLSRELISSLEELLSYDHLHEQEENYRSAPGEKRSEYDEHVDPSLSLNDFN
jgi:hypothetical protein